MRRTQAVSSTVAAAVIAVVLLTTVPAHGVVTPFGQQVHDAIEEGLAWIRTQANGGIGGESTGLAMVAMLEKRESADWQARRTGYVGLDPADQQLMREAARYIIDNNAGFGQVGGAIQSYPAGSALMALAVFLATGGPVDVGAQRTVAEAIDSATVAFKADQGRPGELASGGWNYSGAGGNRCDLSTTQFAAAGLSAAETVAPGAADTLPRMLDLLSGTKMPDGGHQYECNRQGVSHAMTASGIWCYALAGAEIDNEGLQQAMQWMQRNYRYDGQTNWWTRSYYYYLWAAAKGLEINRRPDRGALPGVLYAEDIGGTRDPNADGFPAETEGWYYDFAWQLLEDQSPDGSWPTARPNGSNGQEMVSDTAFAILVLERSLGGVCIDVDKDNVCDFVDNCEGYFNPEQDDRDGDEIGTGCDNCPDDFNPDQEDAIGDGIGDVCRPDCEPEPEICNDADDDCDREVDEDCEEPGEGEGEGPAEGEGEGPAEGEGEGPAEGEGEGPAEGEGEGPGEGEGEGPGEGEGEGQVGEGEGEGIGPIGGGGGGGGGGGRRGGRSTSGCGCDLVDTPASALVRFVRR